MPSAFYDRFTPACVACLRACLARGLDELIRHTRVAVADRLHAFRDRVVAEGTIVRLPAPLAARFPGVKNAAELKVSIWPYTHQGGVGGTAGPVTLRHCVLGAEGLRHPLAEIVPLMLHEGGHP